jgi:GTP pyrophosphokinase
MPKFNLYQSLHTTVIGPQGKQVEFQIRTYDMHRRAEYGVAAHWDYKGVAPADEMAWLSRIVEWQEETTDPNTFMENLKMDLEQDEIFLFSPKGKVIALPIGATTVDFAYAIHTEVGHACVGARVDGRLVPLETRLNSGSIVEIITSKQPGAGPSRDWLKFVVSHRAENRIRHWYSRERRAEAADRGHEELVEELRQANMPIKKTIDSEVFSEIAASLNYFDIDSVYAAIGEGNLSPKSLVNRVERSLLASDPEQVKNVSSNVLRARPQRRTQDEVGVHVEGLDDLLVRLSRCCTPVPPDEIMGFVTRGRGVTVHRTDCANAVSLSADQPDRLIDVEWDQQADAFFTASIEVKALDRPLLLRDLVNVLADHQMNVLGASTITSEDDRVARLKFDFELGDPSHLDPIMRIMRGIHSVYDVYRVVPGQNT